MYKLRYRLRHDNNCGFVCDQIQIAQSFIPIEWLKITMDAEITPILNILREKNCEFVIPVWQRRYCWGQNDIERLVNDLETIAQADSDVAKHYGGTLILLTELRNPGWNSPNTSRVVDGQQRLTTVSILLACIANKLGSEGEFRGLDSQKWNAKNIYGEFLLSSNGNGTSERKIRLQEGDDKEYELGLNDRSPFNMTTNEVRSGSGAVAQAWLHAERLLHHDNIDTVFKGLERLNIINTSLDKEKDDPQQVFESLNATGRPLTESEKVKNWLLIGLSEEEQLSLFKNYWQEIENNLNAKFNSVLIDTFLRDYLRWKIGEVKGVSSVYEEFRRWAMKSQLDIDRPKLCKDLARVSKHYGMLTLTVAEGHRHAGVQLSIEHLHRLNINVHRPLTLRLLDDASRSGETGFADEELAGTFNLICSWITRLWLADMMAPGLNARMAELAHRKMLSEETPTASFWREQIDGLSNTNARVPNDGEVREGMASRKAYGGNVTKSTFAILYALTLFEKPDEPVAPETLTVEHVLPRTPGRNWSRGMQKLEFENLHAKFCNVIANLTLWGDKTNSSLGAKSFAEKKREYKNSSVGITRRIANEEKWDLDAIERRHEELSGLALSVWQWHDQTSSGLDFKWRIEEGKWKREKTASGMLLNVTRELLDRDPANAKKLLGKNKTSNLNLAKDYPSDGSMVHIPGHEDYVINRYSSADYVAKYCVQFGKKCGVRVVVELGRKRQIGEFWKFLLSEFGGLPGQSEDWSSSNKTTSQLNHLKDAINVRINNKSEIIQLNIVNKTRNEGQEDKEEIIERMLIYSQRIVTDMSDQLLVESYVDIQELAEAKKSISIKRSFELGDEGKWSDIGQWVVDQFNRLYHIVESDES